MASEADGAKLAEMLGQPLVITENYTLVDVELLTGRMHQIRLQLASRGFPVVVTELWQHSNFRTARSRGLSHAWPFIAAASISAIRKLPKPLA